MLKLNKTLIYIVIFLLAKTAFALEFPSIPVSLDDKIGISILDAEDGQVVYEYNSNAPMHIASNMKMITSYVALIQLSLNFRWPTRLAYSGSMDKNGKLNGDIYLIGSGDPTLTSQDIEDIFEKAQIHNINGNLFLDNSIFNSIVPTSELHPEPYAAYSANPNGLLINTGLSQVKATMQNSKVRLIPDKIGKYQLKNNLRYVRAKVNCIDINDYVTITNPRRHIIELNGLIPVSCNKQFIGINLYPNFIYNKKIINQILTKKHIKLSGSIEFGTAPESYHLLYTHNSQTLLPIMMQTNKFSNNTAAKTLFLTLGAYKSANRNTYLDSRRIYLQTIKQEFNFPELDSENGSGLSRKEKLTTAHMTQFLERIYHGPFYNDFLKTLPTPGEPGTLQNSFHSFKHQLYAKTGTLDDAKAYSGYFFAADGHIYIISFIANQLNRPANNSNLSQFKHLVEKFLTALNTTDNAKSEI